MRHTYSLIALALLASPAFAQPSVPPAEPYKAAVAELEKLITHEVDDKRLPALSIALVVAYFTWPTSLGGCTTLTIVSGHSMEPTYYTNDIVVSRCGTPEVGDIAVYATPETGGARIVHRVIGGDGETGWEFQGDNNDFVDQFRPTDDQVLGTAVLHIPRAGLVAKAVSSPMVSP